MFLDNQNQCLTKGVVILLGGGRGSHEDGFTAQNMSQVNEIQDKVKLLCTVG
jgi:hypothetical protein